MGFGDSVGKAADKMQKEVNDKIVGVSQELFSLIVRNTPVGNRAQKGQLINNWYVGIGKGQYNLSSHGVSDTSGGSSFEQVAALARCTDFVGKDGAVSFTNSTYYGYRAEYFGWNWSADEPSWRGTAPYAMVAKSLVVVAAKYKSK